MSAIHHVAITASNFNRSLEFYKKIGFVEYFNQDFPEKSKRLALLRLDDLRLELFWYKDSTNNPGSRAEMGNNVHDVGYKHFALLVESLENKYEKLQAIGIKPDSEIELGDGGYKFFFIRDPDGIWVEYVED